jgi:hypothetical protein
MLYTTGLSPQEIRQKINEFKTFTKGEWADKLKAQQQALASDTGNAAATDAIDGSAADPVVAVVTNNEAGGPAAVAPPAIHLYNLCYTACNTLLSCVMHYTPITHV